MSEILREIKSLAVQEESLIAARAAVISRCMPILFDKHPEIANIRFLNIDPDGWEDGHFTSIAINGWVNGEECYGPNGELLEEPKLPFYTIGHLRIEEFALLSHLQGQLMDQRPTEDVITVCKAYFA